MAAKRGTNTEQRLATRGIAVFTIFAVGAVLARGHGGASVPTSDRSVVAAQARPAGGPLDAERSGAQSGHLSLEADHLPHGHARGVHGDHGSAASDHQNIRGHQAHGDDKGHAHAHGATNRSRAWYDELGCYGPNPYAMGHEHGNAEEAKPYRGGTNSTQDRADCPVGVPRLGTYPCFNYMQSQVLRAIDVWEGTVRWLEEALSTVVNGVRVWDQGARSTAMGYQTKAVPLNYMVHHAKNGSFNDPGTVTRDGKSVRFDKMNSIIYGSTWEGYRPIGAMYVSSGESAWFKERAPAEGPGGGQGGTPAVGGYDPRVFVRPTGEDPELWARHKLADRGFWKNRKQHRHAALRGIHGWAAMKAAGYNPVGIPETHTGCILDWHAHLDAASSLTNSDMMHVWTVRSEEQHKLSSVTGPYQYGYPNGEFIESPLLHSDGRRLTYNYAACRSGLARPGFDTGAFKLDHPKRGKVAQTAYARLGPDCRPYRYYFNGMGNPRTNRGYGPLFVYNPVSEVYGDDCRTGFPIPSSFGGALGGGGSPDDNWDEQIRNLGNPQPCDSRHH